MSGPEDVSQTKPEYGFQPPSLCYRGHNKEKAGADIQRKRKLHIIPQQMSCRPQLPTPRRHPKAVKEEEGGGTEEDEGRGGIDEVEVGLMK